jgi:transcriptional regulator
MYLPAHFEETRTEVLHALIRSHPLGTLVTLDAGGALQANPIPFLIEPGPLGHGALRGHVARANALWRETRAEVEALVVFQGAQSYVSPGWYPSKAEHGKVVPTFNYVVVQARGRLRAVDDAAWVRALVARLTQRFEADRAAPWAIADAPAEYIETMLRAIVGIEIELTALVGKWKVSQNRNEADREGVVAGLKALAAQGCNGEVAAMAGEVAQRHAAMLNASGQPPRS